MQAYVNMNGKTKNKFINRAGYLCDMQDSDLYSFHYMVYLFGNSTEMMDHWQRKGNDDHLVDFKSANIKNKHIFIWESGASFKKKKANWRKHKKKSQ